MTAAGAIKLGDAGILQLWEAAASYRGHERGAALVAAVAAASDDSGDRWSIGRCDRRLLELHAEMFGSAFAAVTACPACLDDLELRFAVKDLRAGVAGLAEEFELEGDEWRVRFRAPTYSDLTAVTTAASVPAGRRLLAERCVVDSEPAWASLPDAAIDAMEGTLAVADGQADIRLDLSCPVCGHSWEAVMDLADFLWRELDARTRRLLLDVHVIALRYGWSEAEILSLSERRRELYMEIMG